jgi:hypothetical protein
MTGAAHTASFLPQSSVLMAPLVSD